MDDIIRQLTQFTISNLDSPPYVGATIEEVAEALNQLSVSDDLRPPSSPPSRSTHPQSNTQPPEDDLDRLVFLDNQLDSHIQRILSCLDSLADPNPTSQQDIQLDLTKEQKLLRASLRQLGGLETHNEAAVCELAGAMRERLAVYHMAIRCVAPIPYSLCKRHSSPQRRDGSRLPTFLPTSFNIIPSIIHSLKHSGLPWQPPTECTISYILRWTYRHWAMRCVHLYDPDS